MKGRGAEENLLSRSCVVDDRHATPRRALGAAARCEIRTGNGNILAADDVVDTIGRWGDGDEITVCRNTYGSADCISGVFG